MRSNSEQHFGLAYLGAEELGAYLSKQRRPCTGRDRVRRQGRCPATPVARRFGWTFRCSGRRRSSFEVWTSNAPVSICAVPRDRRQQRRQCGVWQRVAGAARGCDAGATRLAGLYTRIFQYIDHHGYRNLLRVWHYFPQINDDENGLERYRSFNIGRHAAFVANGRTIGEEHVPAASALGSNSGSLVIYFIARRQPGKPVENPRQISAYHYPKLFGPRSPIFVRAMSADAGRTALLLHLGYGKHRRLRDDCIRAIPRSRPAKPSTNIHALLQQNPHYDPARGRMMFKVYLRHAEDLQITRSSTGSRIRKRTSMRSICIRISAAPICCWRSRRHISTRLLSAALGIRAAAYVSTNCIRTCRVAQG